MSTLTETSKISYYEDIKKKVMTELADQALMVFDKDSEIEGFLLRPSVTYDKPMIQNSSANGKGIDKRTKYKEHISKSSDDCAYIIKSKIDSWFVNHLK